MLPKNESLHVSFRHVPCDCVYEIQGHIPQILFIQNMYLIHFSLQKAK